jgi:hypothetical protein
MNLLWVRYINGLLFAFLRKKIYNMNLGSITFIVMKNISLHWLWSFCHIICYLALYPGYVDTLGPNFSLEYGLGVRPILR